MPYTYYQPMGVTDPVETMYPEIYYKMYPMVANRAERYLMENGPYHNPTKEYLGGMVQEIVDGVNYHDQDLDIDYRQFDARDLLTGLATVLLVRELVDRRRPFHRRRPHYGHHYGGYYY